MIHAATLAWRRQTTPSSHRRAGSGERTVVALSGGADSSGLLIGLTLGAGVSKLLAVHVVHDLRSEPEAEADAEACAELCGRLGVELVVERIRVRGRVPEHARGDGGRMVEGPSNLEARARRLRYTALARAARSRGIVFIATAHHADDQLETLLMRLMRGAGPRGLSGIPQVRSIGDLRVIRPLLAAGAGRGASGSIDGEALRRLCTEFGWKWREDASNNDPGQLRAAIRARVAPVLKALRPGVAAAAARSAGLLHAAAELVDDRVDSVCSRAERRGGDGAEVRVVRWSRADLRREPAMVVGAVLRREALGLLAERNEGGDVGAGAKGADRMTARTLAPAVRAIRDSDTARRTFSLGSQVGKVHLVVTTRWVTIERSHSTA